MEKEKLRYSDAELMEFKAVILEKLEAARLSYEQLRSSMSHSSSNGTDDTSPTFKSVEDGANTLNREENERLAQRQMKFINDLEAALGRIENKTYGICSVTGKLIPKERLLLVPHTTKSMEAKTSQ